MLRAPYNGVVIMMMMMMTTSFSFIFLLDFRPSIVPMGRPGCGGCPGFEDWSEKPSHCSSPLGSGWNSRELSVGLGTQLCLLAQAAFQQPAEGSWEKSGQSPQHP
jgi:hypothetical protein